MLNTYIIENYHIDSSNDVDYFDNRFLKLLAIYGYGLTEIEKYSAIMGQFNFKKDNIDYDCAAADDPLDGNEIFA